MNGITGTLSFTLMRCSFDDGLNKPSLFYAHRFTSGSRRCQSSYIPAAGNVTVRTTYILQLFMSKYSTVPADISYRMLTLW